MLLKPERGLSCAPVSTFRSDPIVGPLLLPASFAVAARPPKRAHLAPR